jgi:C4-dicarboxylate-specific signal transduction histidine kinase
MSLDAATGAIAHEIAQPLTAIAAYGSTIMNWLKRTSPDLDEVRTSATAIVEASHRANEIVLSIRALFRKTDDRRNLIHLDDVAREVLGLLQHDLEDSQVAVATEYASGTCRSYTTSANRLELGQKRNRGHEFCSLWLKACAGSYQAKWKFDGFAIHPR